jgi:uncharacterized protein
MEKIFLAALFFVLGAVLTTAFYSNALLYAEADEVILQDTSDVVKKKVPIAAVNNREDEGVIGTLELKLIPGNSNVLIDTDPYIETDLQHSSNMAVDVAKSIAKNKANNIDFLFTYRISSKAVGGQSAGAAATIVAIAALENRDIKDNIILTGTVNEDGTIGPVHGILEKAKAASDAGYEVLLVPEGQSRIVYFEPTFDLSFSLSSRKFTPKTLNLDEIGIEIIEVGSIQEAQQYMVI